MKQYQVKRLLWIFFFAFSLLSISIQSEAQNVSNFPNGISTDARTEPFGEFPLPNPFEVTCISSDFIVTDISQTVFVNSGTGYSLIPAVLDGGVMQLTLTAGQVPAGTDTDGLAYYVTNRFCAPEVGKKMWFASKFQIKSPTTCQFYTGAFVGSASKWSDGDGYEPENFIGFNVDVFDQDVEWGSPGASFVDNATVDFVSTGLENTWSHGIKNVTQTSINKWAELAWFYDGDDEMKIFANNQHIGTATTTKMTTATMSLYFGGICKDVAFSTAIILIDYLLLAKEK